MQDTESLARASIDLVERLVAFDTTSRVSNLELIAFVEDLFRPLGARMERVASDDGMKSNLLAMIGPGVEGGVVLSGHTDVVPVDGQPWSTDPFKVDRRDGRLYGRGTSDMKSFIACALAAAPLFARAGLKRPVHFAFSYDEEVGCIGAPRMIDRLVERGPRPSAVIVGEPTNMEAVYGHKGISSWRVTVHGREAHSSLTHLGVSANMAAIRLMASLVDISDRLEREADPASPFTPKGATLTIGQVNGGTAVNILARECVFVFDLRCPPGLDPDAILAPFLAEAAALDAQMKRRAPEAGVRVERRSRTPPLAPHPDNDAERLARGLAGDNGPARVVPYAAEAGQFQDAGYATVICGPGSIEQAHQPDEFIEIAQVERCAAFMARLAERLAAD